MSRKIRMTAKTITAALIAMVCLQLGSARLVAEAMTATQPTAATGTGAATLSKVGPTAPGAPSAASLRRVKEMQQAERDRAAREATYAADRAMRLGVTLADPVLSTAAVIVPVGKPAEAVASAGTVNMAAPVRNKNDSVGKSVATLFAPPKFTPPPGLSDGRNKVAGQPTLFGSHEILLGQSVSAKRGGNSTELRPVTLPTQIGVYRKDLPATVAPFSSAAAASRQMTLPALLP
jgi:hypothetical protein